ASSVQRQSQTLHGQPHSHLPSACDSRSLASSIQLPMGCVSMRPNYNSTKVCFAYFGLSLGGTGRKGETIASLLRARPTSTSSNCRTHPPRNSRKSFFSVAEHFAAQRAWIDTCQVLF